jgi:hypothetical protein
MKGHMGYQFAVISTASEQFNELYKLMGPGEDVIIMNYIVYLMTLI